MNKDSEFDTDMEQLTLSDIEREYLKKNPGFFAFEWLDVTDALLMKHWPEIMMAQAIKAKKGDTAAAKFITEFVQTRATAFENNDNEQAVEDWEYKAIELRNKLSIEVSALTLVELLLNKLLTMDTDQVRELLTN